MKKAILVTVLFVLIINVSGQNPYLELTFTAVDNTTNIQLDSIKVMNRIQDCDTVLYLPDTLLLLGSGPGTHEYIELEKVLKVFQNYPNPVIDHTTISLYVPERDNVSIIITDVTGRTLYKSDQVLEEGYHSFRYIPGSGNLFFFTAQWRGYTSSIKILHNGTDFDGAGSLEYTGYFQSEPQFKATIAVQGFTFSFGDTLLYIGYTDSFESGILDAPESHDTYTFQFATNIPCPGIPTVTYEGQVYNTIQIFSQCWLKENLNVGTMIQGSEEMTDNGILEKYCYDNEPDSCSKYGGLYQWWEMMQYTTQPGVQGICPPGWHLPLDEEWKVLEGAVDSKYGIGNSVWNQNQFRGYDAGTNLKTTSGWYGGGNGTDLFGFSGLPGGYRYDYGSFYDISGNGRFWTSTGNVDDLAWYRTLNCYYPEVGRYEVNTSAYGLIVRCVREE